jgi:hypothetical protein
VAEGEQHAVRVGEGEIGAVERGVLHPIRFFAKFSNPPALPSLEVSPLSGRLMVSGGSYSLGLLWSNPRE